MSEMASKPSVLGNPRLVKLMISYLQEILKHLNQANDYYLLQLSKSKFFLFTSNQI